MLLYNTNKPFLCRLSGSFTFRSTISELSSPFCVMVIWFLRLHDHSLFVRQRCSWFAKRPAALLGLTDLSHAALARGHHVLVLRCTYAIKKHRWCYTCIMKLVTFKYCSLDSCFFLSLHQLPSIYTGEWEAVAFSAPSVGVRVAVSTLLAS